MGNSSLVKNNSSKMKLNPFEIPPNLFSSWKIFLEYFLSPQISQIEISEAISTLGTYSVPIEDKSELTVPILKDLGINPFIANRISAIKMKV
jgi:hypothetical protein